MVCTVPPGAHPLYQTNMGLQLAAKLKIDFALFHILTSPASSSAAISHQQLDPTVERAINKNCRKTSDLLLGPKKKSKKNPINLLISHLRQLYRHHLPPHRSLLVVGIICILSPYVHNQTPPAPFPSSFRPLCTRLSVLRTPILSVLFVQP